MSRTVRYRHVAATLATVALIASLLSLGGLALSTPASASTPMGSAYTWGDNGTGQLGDGTASSSLAPVAVDTSGVLNGESIRQIAGTSTSFCVLTDSAKVFCWGQNTSGQLGNDDTTNSNVPVAVDTSGALAGKIVTQISVATTATCALTADGLVFCWGGNSLGQLGNGTTDDTKVPVAVDTSGVLAGRTVTNLSSGGVGTFCGLLDNGSIACWGGGGAGQMGNGTTTSSNLSPVLVDTSGVLNGKTPIGISVGDLHVCVVTSDASASCWGRNVEGQLGDGSVTNSAVPVLVDTAGALAGQDVAVIEAGANSSCAITTAGIAYCWGENGSGQLGTGTQTNSSTPVAVDASGILSNEPLSTISVSSFSGCATTVSGKVACWGSGTFGQLGNGSTGLQVSPVWADTTGVLSSVHVEEVVAATFSTASWGRASDGCATPSAPLALGGVYQVGTAAHLEWIRDDTTRWDDSYILVGDIDVDGCTWTRAIGDDTTAFTGVFDGDGHAISNIDVDISVGTTNNVSAGLFGQAGAGHIIRDLHVAGDVVGTSPSAPKYVQVGGVVGYASGGIIERVTFEGNVTATQATPHATRVVAGGLVGILWDDTITQSGVSRTTVIAEKGDPYAGGLVGLAQGGSASGTQTWVHDSYTWSAWVTARDQISSFGSIAGGLIGGMSSGVGDAEIRDSFARGTATVRNSLAVGIRGSAGGVVGYADQGIIRNTYAYVDVKSVNPQGTDRLGRVAGYVTSAPTGGGNFWDSEIGGPSAAIGFDGGSSLTGIGVSKSAMETMSTFSNAGWAIVNTYEPPGTNTWGICEGQSYPYLLWSAQTLTTPGNPCSTTPTISGTAAVGQTLVGSFSSPLSSVTYRWWRLDAQGNDVPLIDYDETYVVSAADIGTRLFVEGYASENGIGTTVYSAPTSIVPDPNPPTPPTPASPPRDVQAVAGDREVTVSWQPPGSAGSFAVSQYQMQASPGGASCLATAPQLTCVITGLTNGESYTVSGRALTGAGWSTYSAPSAAVVPNAEVRIVITGSRDGRRVVVNGETSGLVGQQVTPWVRFPGPHAYEPGVGVRTVDEVGEFIWQRETGKKTYVYFRAEDGARSNRVVIAAR